MPNATGRAAKKTTTRTPKAKASPTAVVVDDTVVAVTSHVDVTDKAEPDVEFLDWLATATDEELGNRLPNSGDDQAFAILAELDRRDAAEKDTADVVADQAEPTATVGGIDTLPLGKALAASAEQYANTGVLAGVELSDNGAMEAFLGSAERQEARRKQAAADAEARRQAGTQYSPEERAAAAESVATAKGMAADEVSDAEVEEELAASAQDAEVDAVSPRRELPAPDLAEGQVMDVDQIRELRRAGHRSPTRVYGTPLEQARQATAWGYDGHVFPHFMAPDAGEEDWQAVQAEEKEQLEATARINELAELGEPGRYRVVSNHPATWSTEEGADPTVCVVDDCTFPRDQHVDVPAHVPTPAEWAERVRRAEEAAADVAKPEPVAEPKPAKAKPAAVVAAVGEVTLALSTAELALASVTLGRFGYRAYDSWGDELAPFDYADGTVLPDPVKLPGNRAEALHKALVDHGAWLGKAKKANPDRVAAVTALTAKVAAALAG